MKVLIVGGGGREHALAWKVASSQNVSQVLVAPGNAGTDLESKVTNVPIAADNIPALIDYAKSEHIDLTIIGPEQPLVNGIVDEFIKSGLRCFGPQKNAAILEGSKSFAKEFLKRHNIPTAAYGVFTDVKSAIQFIHENKFPLVIKADGLAAGKGVVIVQTEAEAIATINDMLQGNKFGDAGHRIVIEEFLQGEEASFIVMSDGKHILPLVSSQDHKARDNGDQGPNTGGMGAYSPAPVVTDAIHDRIMQEVVEPAIQGLASENRNYVGFLYAGVMIDRDGTPNVLEFNCRFGDPETQPIMMRLNSDLVDLCNAAIDGRLDAMTVNWDKRAALGVVLAARGYPDNPEKGDVIQGLDKSFADNIKVFHAGTKVDTNNIVTAGGRVLCVTALGDTVKEAQSAAYDAISHISWNGMFCRTDIGYRAVQRESKP